MVVVLVDVEQWRLQMTVDNLMIDGQHRRNWSELAATTLAAAAATSADMPLLATSVASVFAVASASAVASTLATDSLPVVKSKSSSAGRGGRGGT